MEVGRTGEGSDGAGIYGKQPTQLNTETIAQLLMHELAHIRGEHDHKDLANCWDFDCGWAKDFQIRPKQEKPKEKIDIKKVRYEQVLSKIKDKEARIKRLKNAIKKLYLKRKYYEKG